MQQITVNEQICKFFHDVILWLLVTFWVRINYFPWQVESANTDRMHSYFRNHGCPECQCSSRPAWKWRGFMLFLWCFCFLTQIFLTWKHRFSCCTSFFLACAQVHGYFLKCRRFFFALRIGHTPILFSNACEICMFLKTADVTESTLACPLQFCMYYEETRTLSLICIQMKP